MKSLSTLLVLLALPLTATAQSNRTFVSAQLGNDANLCGPTAPCRSFFRAIPLTNTGGEVVVLDSGGYGPFSVAKAITIQAPSGVYAGCTTTSGTGASIAAGATDTVILRGLTFNGVGTATTGVSFTSGAVLHIESCIINAFTGNSIDSNISASVFVNDTTIRNGGLAGGRGISIGTGTASINRCRIERYDGNGVVAHDGANVMTSETVAAGNLQIGFDAESSATLTLENCVSSGNGTGVQAGSGATTRVSNSVIANNNTGLAGGGSLLTRKNNMVEGNPIEGTFSGTIVSK